MLKEYLEAGQIVKPHGKNTFSLFHICKREKPPFQRITEGS